MPSPCSLFVVGTYIRLQGIYSDLPRGHYFVKECSEKVIVLFRLNNLYSREIGTILKDIV